MYSEHLDRPLSSGAVPKVPCLGLRKNFFPKLENDFFQSNISVPKSSIDDGLFDILREFYRGEIDIEQTVDKIKMYQYLGQ